MADGSNTRNSANSVTFLGERSLAELTSRSLGAAATTNRKSIQLLMYRQAGLDIIPTQKENAVLDNYLMLNNKQPPKKEAALLNKGSFIKKMHQSR